MLTNTIEYTIDDIIEVVSNPYYIRGKTYYRQGRVEKASFQGSQLQSLVQGNEAYHQSITFHNDTIEGLCTCPIGYNCKHVAAVLLHALDHIPMSSRNYITSGTVDRFQTHNWLEKMESEINVASPEKPKTKAQKKQLIYILKIDEGVTKIIPYTLSFNKDGTYSKTSSAYNLSNITNRRQFPNHIKSGDQLILMGLERLNINYTSHISGYSLNYSGGAYLLNKIVGTKKCHWNTIDGPILAKGNNKKAAFSWKMQDNGTQNICCTTDTENDTILNMDSPWYLSKDTQSCGELITPIPHHIANALLSAPPLNPTEVETVRKKLNHYVSKIDIPVPAAFKQTEKTFEKPIPHLYLHSVELTERRNFYDTTTIIPLIKVQFNYGGNRVTKNDTNSIYSTGEGRSLIHHIRHIKTENDCVNKLQKTYKFCQLSNYAHLYNVDSTIKNDLTFASDNFSNDTALSNNWIEFMTKVIPALQKEGWQIEIDESFPHNVTYPDNDWYAEIDDTNGNDWFNLELGVSVNGEKINLLPILLGALRDGTIDKDIKIESLDEKQQWFCKLLDGTRLALPAKRIWTMMSFLKDLYNFENLHEDGTLELSRINAADLAELEDAMAALNLRWFGGEKIRKLGKKLKNFNGIKKITPPKNFKAKLRDYQKDGLNWMQFLREYELGGILADDMGLGKTIQALAYIQREKQDKRLKKPMLVIAPTSVIVNWEMEIERFTPTLKTLTLHGAERRQHFNTLDKYEVILTTYPLLARDKQVLLKQEFHTIILDEAQYIKNTKAKKTQVVCQLKAAHRICMTGTPIENHLGELWSQFNFLLPGFLGDEKKFRQFFRNPIEKEGNRDRNAALTRRIKPFILRRTKDEIASELPPKTHIIRTVDLEKSQRDLYETIRISMQKKVRDEIAKKGFSRSHFVVLEALLRLRQTCCDPRLLKIEASQKIKESAKLTLLMDMLGEMIEKKRKILIFSQFVSMLKLIEAELANKGYDYVKLTGQTKDRNTPVSTFQKSAIPIFLISLKAGGTGLNLTAADTVIHYDPWWNPAVENQATDRAHRIGQKKPVFVYKLLTNGTVEERILQMQEKKKALADGIFNPDNKAIGALTANDINALFEPID